MRFWQIVPAVGATVVAACGLGDLFQSPTITNVVLAYTGPTVVSVSDTVPLSVSVAIKGAAVPSPRLWVTSSDTSIIALSANSDTLIARARGFDTLTIRLVGSIYTDSFPTIRQAVRVNP